MYRVYYSDPETDFPHCATIGELYMALSYCEQLRQEGYTYVTMVSDYHNMVGKPGVQAAGSEYVPQLK